jgi:hypothetical protein
MARYYDSERTIYIVQNRICTQRYCIIRILKASNSMPLKMSQATLKRPISVAMVKMDTIEEIQIIEGKQ